jgi:hypothetical protein
MRSRWHAWQIATVITEHPYLSVTVLALVARAVTAVVVWAAFDGTLYQDDLFYTKMAVQAARGQTGTWDDYTHWLFGHTSTMLYPLTGLYRLLGTSSTLPGQLAIAVVGATVAGLAARLYRHVSGRSGALVVGTLVALLPSQVVLSSVALKDPPVWAVLIGIALLLARPDNGRLAMRATTPIGAAVLLVLLAHLRLHTCVVAAIALALTSLVSARRDGAIRAGSLLIVAVVTPWFVGLGPLGSAFIADHAGSIDVIRSSNARGDTAISAATTTTTSVPDTLPTSPSAPTSTPPPAPPATDGPSDIGYLPHGVAALVAQPAPWQLGSGKARLAGLEGVIWYPLLLLALFGLLGARRHLDVLAFPIIIGAGTLVMWSLVEGNLGTAYRHRGEFTWVVCVLAGLGGEQLLDRWRVRRST